MINARGGCSWPISTIRSARWSGRLEACGLKTGADAILIDFHAEATSEKEAIGLFRRRACERADRHAYACADRRRADPPRGTAYISDAGMCGDFDSVLGMDKEEPLQRFLTKIPSGRFTPALGEATLCGVAIDVDDATGLARVIAPLRQGGRLSQTEPSFWLAESLSRAKLGAVEV